MSLAHTALARIGFRSFVLARAAAKLARPRLRAMGARARSVAEAALDHIDAVAVVAVLAMLIAFVALDLTGHRLFVVAGASMEPAVARWSLLVVRPTLPAALAVGDVITFDHRGQTVTHRVARIDDSPAVRVFTTKGDANEATDPDPVAFDGQVGLLVAHVPALGYALALIQWAGRPISLVTGLLLTIWALRRYRSLPFPLAARA